MPYVAASAAHWRAMWVVGATTATRATRPSCSIRWATCRPNVVLPAAGVAEARKASPGWEKTASAAACCHARSGRSAGQDGRVKRSGSFLGSGSYVKRAPQASRSPRRIGVRQRTGGASAASGRADFFDALLPVAHADVGDHALLLVALDIAPELPGAGREHELAARRLAALHGWELVGLRAELQPQVVRVLGEAVVELHLDAAGEQRGARELQLPAHRVGVPRDDLEVARVVRRWWWWWGRRRRDARLGARRLRRRLGGGRRAVPARLERPARPAQRDAGPHRTDL